MSRLSFSHTLLASFLLTASILGAAALGGLFVLEELAARTRNNFREALGLSTAIQQLGERTVDMERSARQFLVLDDPALLERFHLAHDEARRALQRIAALQTARARALVADWQDSGAAAAQALAKEDASPALEALSRLPLLNEKLTSEIRLRLDEDNEALLAQLEDNRNRLAWHLIAALLAACVLAALTGWWVLRPLARVERTIEALGESRFDERVEIDGPADLRRLGRRLDWLRLRLADLEANRARVLRHVSHELKTPLASLREGIALLEDGVVGGLNGQQRVVVGILEHNTRALQERIEGLLGYNAAVFDARSLKRQPLELRALIESVTAEQQLPIRSRGLTVRIEGEAARIHADPDKLRIVLGNLLGNAISFSPKGGEVRMAVRTLPGRVQIDCIDQGPGVPPEEAERIFEPFFQGSRQPAEERQGSGLGLSIVREFILAHGGRVELIASEAGAHFRIELPNES